MARTHALLAEKFQKLAPSVPLVLTAMAETAVGLGRGLFEAWTELGGVREALFLQTTRLKLDAPLLTTLEEPHCHAPIHLIYEPVLAEARRVLADAETLALVDDEMTTGRTLTNLARALIRHAPRVKRLILVSLTDWLGPAARASLIAELPRPADFISLMEGEFDFEPATSWRWNRSPGEFLKISPLDAAATRSATPTTKEADVRPFVPTREPRSVGGIRSVSSRLPVDFGRLGLMAGRATVSPKTLDKMIDSLKLAPDVPVLTLGSGEFLHEPFLLARRLEESGREVLFQSSTRTPVALGGDVTAILSFEDEYGEGLDNFLYNVAPVPGRETLVCHEVSAAAPGHDLAAKLGARTVLF
jgi:hypothetical protein